MDYRLETIEGEDGNDYYIHHMGDNHTDVVAFCTDSAWAWKVIDGLRWLDAFESGSMSIPKTMPKTPMKLIFHPAPEKKKPARKIR